jgi:hypothetical protein
MAASAGDTNRNGPDAWAWKLCSASSRARFDHQSGATIATDSAAVPSSAVATART